jgi:hypothetical protein
VLPTLESFERQVRREFVSRIKQVRLRACWIQAAGIEWEEGSSEKIDVLWVDPFQRGIGWAVFHEMVHYVERHRFATDDEKEEPQIEGLANATWRRVEASKARTEWWRRAIDERLVKGDL